MKIPKLPYCPKVRRVRVNPFKQALAQEEKETARLREVAQSMYAIFMPKLPNEHLLWLLKLLSNEALVRLKRGDKQFKNFKPFKVGKL